MKKRIRFGRKSEAVKRKRKSNLGIDFFSQLPDDVIALNILSRLTLREAVKTSILSRRWEKLWRHRFGTDIVLCDIPFGSVYKPRHEYFVAWVDRILKGSMNQPVNELAIRFFLRPSLFAAVITWLKFALQNNVKRLYLHVETYYPTVGGSCVFPDLRKLSSLPPVNSYLKNVCLCDFQNDEMTLEYFLSKLPNLERLCLRGISGKLCLDAACQTLKCLEVVRCVDLKLISAPNLITLIYVGTKDGLELGSSPLLSEFNVGGFCSEFFVKQFGWGFSFVSQLTSLKFEMTAKMLEESISYPQKFTALPVLNYLEVKMYMDECQCLFWPISLMKAAPLLHTFRVEMRTWLNERSLWTEKMKGPCLPELPPKWKWDGQNLRQGETNGHNCLKVVEFHGFAGFRNQWELVIHTLKTVQFWEVMVLELDVHLGYCPVDIYRRHVKTIAEALVAPGTELVVRNSSVLPSNCRL